MLVRVEIDGMQLAFRFAHVGTLAKVAEGPEQTISPRAWTDDILHFAIEVNCPRHNWHAFETQNTMQTSLLALTDAIQCCAEDNESVQAERLR
jgi:hypothetical protein